MATRVAASSFIDVAYLQATDCNCSAFEDSALLEFCEAASDALALLSGGRVLGRIQTTVRPCSVDCACGADRCDACSCCRLDAVRLPGIDVTVNSVKIDGLALDAGAYKLMDFEYLVRVGTGARPPSWPGCQHLWRPDTEEGTWSVTYTHGIAPDAVIKAATAEIACNLVSDWPKNRSKLGPGVTAATLGGVSVQVDELVERLRGGDLGLPHVARFLSVYAPNGRVPIGVWSPDIDGDYELHRFS